jgi:hypothetical protein
MGVARVFLYSFLYTTALAAPAAAAADGEALFRQANDAALAGDLPKAIAGYRDVAASGVESASLYWNWAQAAAARGETGEAMWALLRGRAVEPGDGAVAREIERLREAANLDPAEIAPVPLQNLERVCRRFHVDLLAVLLLAASLTLHGVVRWIRPQRALGTAAAVGFGLAVLAAGASLAGAFASPTAVVTRRGTPLLSAASPTASTLGTLREGEVVVVLAESDTFLRVEDSSGARGWATTEHVYRLDRPPLPSPAEEAR